MKRYSHGMKLMIVFSISMIIIFIRNKTAFLYPALVVEDGYFFSHMLNNHNFEQIGFMYAGYRSILPNIIIYFSLFTPFLPLSPYLMGLFCLINSAIACSIFALRRFRYLIPNDTVRYIICLLIAFSPLGDYVLQSNTVYSIWNSLFILLLLIMVPTSSSKVLTVLQTIGSLLIIFSHPMSLIIVPFCGYFVFKRPALRDKMYHSVLIAGVAVYMLTSVEPIKTETSFAFTNLSFGIQLLFERVFFEGIFGNLLRIELNQSFLYAAMIIGIIICAGLIALIYRWRNYLPKYILQQFAISGLIIVGMTMMPTISRNLLLQRDSLLFDPWSANRYFYIQQLFFLLTIVQLGYYRFLHPLHESPPRLVQKPLLTIATTISLCWLLFLNIYHQKTFFSTSLYSGRDVIYFLSSLDKHMHNPAKAPRPIKLERGIWSIVYTGYAVAEAKIN